MVGLRSVDAHFLYERAAQAGVYFLGEAGAAVEYLLAKGGHVDTEGEDAVLEGYRRGELGDKVAGDFLIGVADGVFVDGWAQVVVVVDDVEEFGYAVFVDTLRAHTLAPGRGHLSGTASVGYATVWFHRRFRVFRISLL